MSTTSPNEIYIAGRGLICALGNSLAESLEHLNSGSPAPLEQSQTPFFAIQPEAPANFEAWTARARALIVKAVLEAGGDTIRHAPLFIASSSLNMGAVERGQTRLNDMHAEAEEMAIWLDWQGPVFWVSTACTSSLNALISARNMMRSGLCDDALVLGIELANNYTRLGFSAMQLLSGSTAQPLGVERDGLVLGEAVAAIRLTSQLNTQTQRWALLGGASIVDGKDATGASHEAIVACWRKALSTSGLQGIANPINLLKLQAAGSPSNDAIELSAINEVFATAPALTTLKAHIGHTLGASGAAEIALLSGLLEAGLWPTLDIQHDLELPHELSEQAPKSCARLLASIIGFGGSHACVVLQDCLREPLIAAQESIATPTVWEICGRSGPDLPENWRDELTALLGQRPRRIGTWAEIGLYGALQCLRDASEDTLPIGAILRIGSLDGPISAILQTLQNITDDGMAMPFGFLQSQPGQLPAIVAQAAHWQGDARFANGRDPLAQLAIACCEAGPEGLLIGWLEEPHADMAASSYWLRLRPAQSTPNSFEPATTANLTTSRYVKIDANRSELSVAR